MIEIHQLMPYPLRPPVSSFTAGMYKKKKDKNKNKTKENLG